MCRAEGGAKNFGIFRVKNHDFTPKNHIFSNCGGRRENIWGISCEKSRFYPQKIIFFPNLGGGGGAWCAPPESAPAFSRRRTKIRLFFRHEKSIYFSNLLDFLIVNCMGSVFIHCIFQVTSIKFGNIPSSPQHRKRKKIILAPIKSY